MSPCGGLKMLPTSNFRDTEFMKIEKKSAHCDDVLRRVHDEIVKYQAAKRNMIDVLGAEQALSSDHKAFGLRMLIHECRVDVQRLAEILKVLA